MAVGSGPAPFPRREEAPGLTNPVDEEHKQPGWLTSTVAFSNQARDSKMTPKVNLRQALDDPSLLGSVLAGPSSHARRSLLELRQRGLGAGLSQTTPVSHLSSYLALGNLADAGGA
jgi:hypothetical protein